MPADLIKIVTKKLSIKVYSLFIHDFIISNNEIEF